MKKRIFGQGMVRKSAWSISPTTTPFEALELWRMLVHSLHQGQFFFFSVSMVCILAAIVSALSTMIANQ
jgi:hypothetical protein